MEEKTKKNVGGQKGEWDKRVLSRLIFGQNGSGREVNNRLQHKKRNKNEESKNKD
jgi:hypothetical protein